MPFHHFVQEVNEIWYPEYTIIKLLRYHISRQAIHFIKIILQSLYNINYGTPQSILASLLECCAFIIQNDKLLYYTLYRKDDSQFNKTTTNNSPQTTHRLSLSEFIYR